MKNPPKYGNDKIYWDYRAKKKIFYKNETFYTITPVPLYYFRRWCVLNLLIPFISTPEVKRICDFGVGDGWYIQQLFNQIPDKIWTGADISPGMLKIAKSKCPQADFVLLPSDIGSSESENYSFDKPFDLIFTISVFAHILNDKKINRLFFILKKNLREGGRLVIFEQTGPIRVKRSSFCRNLTSYYKNIAKQNGLSVEISHLIRFPGHVFFERWIAPKFYLYYGNRGSNNFEARIQANQNMLFDLLSRLFLAMYPKSIWRDDGDRWGNSLIVFSKQQNQY